MTDTIIKNNVFKRAGRLRKTYIDGYVRGTYYYDCNMPQTIFKFGFLEKNNQVLYPGCQLVKNELVFDSSGIKLGGVENEIIRYKLTNEEKAIFKSWQENSKKTTLPLLPHSEVLKLSYPEPLHENPTIKIIPRER